MNPIIAHPEKPKTKKPSVLIAKPIGHVRVSKIMDSFQDARRFTPQCKIIV